MNVYENSINLSINNSHNDCPITHKKVKRQIIFEHSYSNSPSKELLTTKKRGRPQTVVIPRKVQLKYRIKRLSQQVRRLKSKITNLKELLWSVRKKGLIGDNEQNTFLD